MVQIKNTVQVDVSYILALEHNNGHATVGSSLCSRVMRRRRFSLSRLSGVLAISLDERPDRCTWPWCRSWARQAYKYGQLSTSSTSEPPTLVHPSWGWANIVLVFHLRHRHLTPTPSLLFSLFFARTPSLLRAILYVWSTFLLQSLDSSPILQVQSQRRRVGMAELT